jgi:hypothetical protein
MSWSEIKKAINSDLSTPLNTLISNVKTSLDSTLSTIKTYASNASSYASTASTRALNTYNIVNNSTYGNSAIKTAVNEVSNKVFTNSDPTAYKWISTTISASTSITQTLLDVTGRGLIYGVFSNDINGRTSISSMTIDGATYTNIPLFFVSSILIPTDYTDQNPGYVVNTSSSSNRIVYVTTTSGEAFAQSMAEPLLFNTSCSITLYIYGYTYINIVYRLI